MSPRIAVALSIVVLAAGCAELRWHKEGVDAAALERELGECQAKARLQAARVVAPFSLAVPYFPGNDAQRRPSLVFPYNPESDYFLLTRNLVHSCMRGKGYALVPVEKP